MNGLQKKLKLITAKSFTPTEVNKETGEIVELDTRYYGINFLDVDKENILNSDLYVGNFADDFECDFAFEDANFKEFPDVLVTFDLVARAEASTTPDDQIKAKATQKVLVHKMELLV